MVLCNLWIVPRNVRSFRDARPNRTGMDKLNSCRQTTAAYELARGLSASRKWSQTARGKFNRKCSQSIRNGLAIVNGGRDGTRTCGLLRDTDTRHRPKVSKSGLPSKFCKIPSSIRFQVIPASRKPTHVHRRWARRRELTWRTTRFSSASRKKGGDRLMNSIPPQPIQLSTACFRKFRLQSKCESGAVASVKVAPRRRTRDLIVAD